MTRNPQQRKPLSLEKLNAIRDKVCQAYAYSKNEELQTPNNKNSVYYSELKEEIRLNTKKKIKISEGTLLKFFHEDINRTYQLITISAIEEYIETVFASISTHNNTSLPAKVEEEIKVFAKRIYIELSTRKAGILIDEGKDVIEDIYNSWHTLFCIIRDELKTLSPDCLKLQEEQSNPVSITFKILNEILRPHLTEHQAKFRLWLEKAKKDGKNRNITPQKLQRKYPDYNVLIKSLKETNIGLIKSAEKLNAIK